MSDIEQPAAQDDEPLPWDRCWGTPEDYQRMLPVLEEAADIVTNVVEFLKDDDVAADHADDAARALDKLIPMIRKRG